MEPITPYFSFLIEPFETSEETAQSLSTLSSKDTEEIQAAIALVVSFVRRNVKDKTIVRLVEIAMLVLSTYL